jgi:hypothetical protein
VCSLAITQMLLHHARTRRSHGLAPCVDGAFGRMSRLQVNLQDNRLSNFMALGDLLVWHCIFPISVCHFSFRGVFYCTDVFVFTFMPLPVLTRKACVSSNTTTNDRRRELPSTRWFFEVKYFRMCAFVLRCIACVCLFKRVLPRRAISPTR